MDQLFFQKILNFLENKFPFLFVGFSMSSLNSLLNDQQHVLLLLLDVQVLEMEFSGFEIIDHGLFQSELGRGVGKVEESGLAQLLRGHEICLIKKIVCVVDEDFILVDLHAFLGGYS